MSLPAALTDTMVDVVFPVSGQALARDHGLTLQQALCARLPWLSEEAGAGIHPIKLVAGLGEQALLPGRARLIVRVAQHRQSELAALCGVRLMLDGHALTLDMPHARPLLAHSTLYAYQVAAHSADETVFMSDMERELSALGVTGLTVCGKRHRHGFEGDERYTFSLMLHALSPAHSLRLQTQGLGEQRLMGCGIFVPHKSAAAVGA